jgi:hypothetical protein
MVAQITTDAMADLAAAYPAWHIWRGKDGKGADKGWCATRQRQLRPAEIDAGLGATLFGDDAASLRGQLTQQAVIEERLVSGSQ